MNCTVLGCGRWGSFLAAFHGRHGKVTLWGRTGSQSYEVLRSTGKNDYVTLPESVTLSGDLEDAIAVNDTIIISISAQHLREFAQRLNAHNLEGKTFILCMKGLEADTGKRLSEVMREEIKQKINVAVWVGPGHTQEFMRDIPNCMVVDSDDRELTESIVNSFQNNLLRLYIGADLVGTEIGAAAKNVMGIAAGMLDGKGLSSLKGALMARGAREIARLISAMGGNELSAYGLCHLGDYEATLFSPHSQNRRFGEAVVKNEPYTKLAEGAATVVAILKLGAEHNVELPICDTVNDVLNNNISPDIAFEKLFSRETKAEF